MRIAVMGSGGIGGFFGGRLARAGEDVTFIARGAHLRAMQDQGLKVYSIKGDFTLPKVTAVKDPAQAGAVDLVLVCVKTWQLSDAIQAMKPMIGVDTRVLPLLNGVEAHDQIRAELPRGRVLGGLARIVSYLEAPGVIRHASVEPYIGLGSMDGRDGDGALRIHEVLTRTGIHAEIPRDLPAALWGKFLLVSAWGALGALTRAPIGMIRDLPQTRGLLHRAMTEVHNLALARNIKLAPDLVDRCMDFVDAMEAQSTTSLQRDIIDGRPSELEAWSGAVVRLGRQAGVPTPVHEFAHSVLLPQEQAARSA